MVPPGVVWGDAIVPVRRFFFGIEPRVSFLCQLAESLLVPRRSGLPI